MNTQERPLLLTAEQVAQALNISIASAYRWMQNGTLPVVRARGCRSVRVPVAALQKWIESNMTAVEA